MKSFDLAYYIWHSIPQNNALSNNKYHEHNTLEFSYIKNGLINFFYLKNGKEEMTQISNDELLIVFPHTIHRREIPYNLNSIVLELSAKNGDVRNSLSDSLLNPFIKEIYKAAKDGILVLRGNRKIETILKDFKQFAKYDELSLVEKSRFELLIKDLIITIYEALDKKMKQKKENPFYQHARMYIEENYYKDIKVEDVVASTNCSRSYLQSLFLNFKKMGVKDAINDFRISKAKELLEETNTPIFEIAKIVGFKSPQVFIECFKRKVLCSPSLYRYDTLHKTQEKYFKDNGFYNHIIHKEINNK